MTQPTDSGGAPLNRDVAYELPADALATLDARALAELTPLGDERSFIGPSDLTELHLRMTNLRSLDGSSTGSMSRFGSTECNLP